MVKILRTIALLGAAIGTIAYQARQMPVLAASSPLDDAQVPAAVDPAVSAAGAKVYQSNCSMCHGEKMEGRPPVFPSLAGKGAKLTSEQITQLVRHGRGVMPAFSTTKVTDADLSALLLYLAHDPTFTPPATPTASGQPAAAQAVSAMAPSPHTQGGAGSSLYQQNCAFCHGRDAGGGESGPDLTRSKLVAEDVSGSTIGPVVRNGRAEGKMPKFSFSDSEMTSLVQFIHAQAKLAAARPGGRRGVDVADLQTGNVAAGKAYFDGAGNCSSCHSPTGNLAGVASRYQGLQLEEQMLYPKDVKDTVTVTLPSGKTVAGRLEYQDEFTIGLRDSNGIYRSWPVTAIAYKIDSPVSAHVDQFAKYTDDDIHNLMAYIQTLK